MTKCRSDVDCEAGRRLGCHTFCCRLLVRLDPDEREPGDGVTPPKGFVDKDPDTGLCIHFDAQTNLCRIWERRPRVCREYSCNPDPLLQVVLQQGFQSLAALLRACATADIRRESYRHIPCRGEPEPGADMASPDAPTASQGSPEKGSSR